MADKNKLTAGKKVRQLRSNKGRKEVSTFLLENYFDEFNFTVLYGRGGVKNHIAISADNPVSLCGRFCEGVSSEPFETPMSSICYVCETSYERAFKAWLGSKAIDRIYNAKLDAALTKVEATIRENPTKWVKAVAGITI